RKWILQRTRLTYNEHQAYEAPSNHIESEEALSRQVGLARPPLLPSARATTQQSHPVAAAGRRSLRALPLPARSETAISTPFSRASPMTTTSSKTTAVLCRERFSRTAGCTFPRGIFASAAISLVGRRL